MFISEPGPEHLLLGPLRPGGHHGGALLQLRARLLGRPGVLLRQGLALQQLGKCDKEGAKFNREQLCLVKYTLVNMDSSNKGRNKLHE